MLLNGLRVLDLSQFLPGPLATRTLSDLGADVIKIEPPRGDPMRKLLCDDDNQVSDVYRIVNYGKRVVRLDLKQDAAKQELSDLIEKTDVLLESFRPGVLERLGFGYETCTSLNPKLVYCSLSGYGQNGPYKYQAGHDINYCAAAGFVNQDSCDAGKQFAFPPLADHTGAMLAAHSILAALYSTQTTGRGHYLDVSIYESMLAFQYINVIDAEKSGVLYSDFLGGGAACYNLYKTKDQKYITLGAVEEHFWTNFCNAMERPDWIERQFEPFPQKDLIQEVGVLFLKRDLKDWNEKLLEVDCCYEPVMDFGRHPQHHQSQSRKLISGKQPGYPAWIDQQCVPQQKPIEYLDNLKAANW